MAIQARRRATTHFDNEVLSRRFADWLENLVGAGSPPLARAVEG